VTSPQELSGRCCPPGSGPPPCSHSTTSTTPASRQPKGWYAQVFVGLRWVCLCPLWPATAYTVRRVKFTAMCRSRLRTFQFRFAVSPTFMSILLVRFPVLQVIRTFLHSWIGRHAGLKLIRSHPSPPPTAQRRSSKAGSRDLGSLESSQATEAHNSPRLYGPVCAHSSTSLTLKPLPTILNLMAS
jgi:hypothetical protein